MKSLHPWLSVRWDAVKAVLSTRSRRKRRHSEQSICQIAEVDSLEQRHVLSASVGLVREIGPGNNNAFFRYPYDYPNESQPIVRIGSVALFAADDGIHGYELWRTDGTSSGTAMVADLNPGSGSGTNTVFFEKDGFAWFSGIRANGQLGIYRTDSTAAATVLMGTFDSSRAEAITNFAASSSRIFMTGLTPGTAGGDRISLFTSDGTPSGTTYIKTFAQSGGLLYGVFQGEAVLRSDTDGLLRSDGTLSGTRAIPSLNGRPINEAVVMNDKLYVLDGSSLYRLDSLDASPFLVASSVDSIKRVGQRLYLGITNSSGRELWVSDGTQTGTYWVSDVNPGPLGSNPRSFVESDGSVFFLGDIGNGVTQPARPQIIRTNRSAQSTFAITQDVNGVLGGTASPPHEIGVFGNQLIFTTAGIAQGAEETWVSNGHSGGAVKLSSLIDDLGIQYPRHFTVLNGKLIFVATTATHGRELYSLTLNDPLPVPTVSPISTAQTILRPTLSWNAVPGAAAYDVWIRNASTGEDRRIVETTTGTAFTPSHDLGIGQYTYWVRAVGDALTPHSEWSAARRFQIVVPPTINDPVFDSAGRPSLTWSTLPGANRYEVWIDRLDQPTSQILRRADVSQNSLSPTNLPKGRYLVWVRGIAIDGSVGAWSVAKAFTSSGSPVLQTSANRTFDATPTLNWTPIIGASHYDVYALRIAGNRREYLQTQIAATTFDSSPLLPGRYRFWVRVTGTTVWSDPIEIDTTGQTILLAPSGATDRTQPLFSWQNIPGATRYELLVHQLGVQEGIINRSNLTTTSFMDNSVFLPKGNYRAWVRAVSATNSAPWSPAQDFSVI